MTTINEEIMQASQNMHDIAQIITEATNHEALLHDDMFAGLLWRTFQTVIDYPEAPTVIPLWNMVIAREKGETARAISEMQAHVDIMEEYTPTETYADIIDHHEKDMAIDKLQSIVDDLNDGETYTKEELLTEVTRLIDTITNHM